MRVAGHGRVVSRRRTVGLTECDLLDAEDGRFVARATSTCMALSGDASTGR